MPAPPASSAYWAEINGRAVFSSALSAGAGPDITGGVLSQFLR